MTQTILTADKIKLDAKPATKKEAITMAGQLLVQAGCVSEDYIQSMMEREELQTTYMGFGVAIPHGTKEAKTFIRSTGISVVQVREGVDFGNGNVAKILIGIAAVGDEHLDIIQNLALLISEEENVDKLVHADTAKAVIDMIEQGDE
ncbi:PTS sugar transporter subunit IIA [Paenibacillus larvae]|uniref:Mannitol-specific phosphotransferase enzyme IIA component n=4 Tax=Paenibacillus larvae TaxID=1464 RepID=V9WEC1_9BACL|nr:PTS sugar transporter subunit IIA [Paenibacillus larvae]AHD07452.1 mannitol-specific phosphotransferase enzyme IIA component MtlF [Paenibacillus larvae subsp. larvae DSM 25430]AQR79094.1 PTS mannitol transporter subunit IIA [Paenibacillus larvae subsp. larvae]AQT85439.1 PTS mannitol transporter subunit IIA [Paenibacillus larvae subsp. pulvifaciens]AQZ47443.1 PTS mannitol transporter subunit IIA [Paenibacillus larvae subsp. pulvifaciens]ARF68755.1 PTS mannitol transporter subunit IIA [Paenib